MGKRATPAHVWSVPHGQARWPRWGGLDCSLSCHRSCGLGGREARECGQAVGNAPAPPPRSPLTLARVVHGLSTRLPLAPVPSGTRPRSPQDSPCPSLSSLPVLVPSSSVCPVPVGRRVGVVAQGNILTMGGWLHACIRPRLGSRECSRPPMQSARGDLFTQTASLPGLARAQAHATPLQPVLPSSSAHSFAALGALAMEGDRHRAHLGPLSAPAAPPRARCIQSRGSASPRRCAASCSPTPPSPRSPLAVGPPLGPNAPAHRRVSPRDAAPPSPRESAAPSRSGPRAC